MSTVVKLFELISLRDRIRGSWLLMMMLVMAILEVVGIASIMPFMAVLSNPELVETNVYLNLTYNRLNFSDTTSFLYFLGMAVFVILIFSLSFKAATNYFMYHYTLRSEYRIGIRLIESYIGQPYSWFLNRNSSTLGKNLLSEIDKVIMFGLLPILNVFAQGAVVIIIIIFLLIIDYQLAMFVGVSIGFIYFVLFKLTGSFLTRIGTARLAANKARYLAVNEVFSAIKEVKVMGLEQTYASRFRTPSIIYAGYQASANVVSMLPRFGLEALAFGGMLLVILFLMKDGEGLDEMLPVMSAYAFAAYRLMPGIQGVYSGISQLSFASPAINTLHADLNELSKESDFDSEDGQMELNKSLELKSVFYTYPMASREALIDINLIIPLGSKIGIVGPTGSGKTTAVDVILGLLNLQSGTIEVDGVVIDDFNRRAWQKSLGYVPQHIYLSDDTIKANIAFGQDINEIDSKAIEVAAKRADLHDFIINDMPLGYETSVGERGARLSGGQRQRIGIARALYRNPRLLILDEATSALDNLTEQSVMNAVYNMADITVIIIAHRLSTIRRCDNILLLEDARASAIGTYEELAENNDTFQAMAKHDDKK